MNRVLIVEDEVAIYDLIKIGLEGQGYICEEASDGEMENILRGNLIIQVS